MKAGIHMLYPVFYAMKEKEGNNTSRSLSEGK